MSDCGIRKQSLPSRVLCFITMTTLSCISVYNLVLFLTLPFAASAVSLQAHYLLLINAKERASHEESLKSVLVVRFSCGGGKGIESMAVSLAGITHKMSQWSVIRGIAKIPSIGSPYCMGSAGLVTVKGASGSGFCLLRAKHTFYFHAARPVVQILFRCRPAQQYRNLANSCAVRCSIASFTRECDESCNARTAPHADMNNTTDFATTKHERKESIEMYSDRNVLSWIAQAGVAVALTTAILTKAITKLTSIDRQSVLTKTSRIASTAECIRAKAMPISTAKLVGNTELAHLNSSDALRKIQSKKNRTCELLRKQNNDSICLYPEGTVIFSGGARVKI